MKCNACQAAKGGICARRCVASSKRTGDRCGQHAHPGANVCRWHGAGAPQTLAIANRRVAVAEATELVVRLGAGGDAVDPSEALLALVAEAAANVAVYRHLVGALEADQLHGLVDTSENKNKSEPNVLVVMYDAERDRLATYAGLALRVGVEERRIRLAEATTDHLFHAVTIALDAAGLTPAQQEAFRLAIANALRAA